MQKQIIPPVLTWTVPSQKRIFQSDMPTENVKRLRAMRNEPVSFSLAYRADAQKEPCGRVPDIPISILVTSDTLPLSVYKVGCVPFTASECEDTDSTAVGPCPDVLSKRAACPEIVRVEHDVHLPFYEKGEQRLLNASCVATNSIYITANEGGETVSAGEHEICIRIISLKTGELLGEHRLTVELIDALLPENDLIYTNWVHYDCLADISGLALWSDEYFELLGKTVKNAALHGMNTLLTPAFTPALDTPVGAERMNVQLVRVVKTEDGYEFDMSLLRRFVTVAKQNGITRFEHCHLFSQWGARTAINVYGEKNEKNIRLFGWDTPATDPEHASFLTAYLTEFLRFAKEMGIENDLIFHISDEPEEIHKESYVHALKTVEKVLSGKTVCDALSNYSFYQNGLVKLPIVDIPFADDFDGKCERMMLYYTGGERFSELTNRLLTSSPWKTRILGLHLFRYNAKGFLHWGYNYTYGRMSHGHFDPLTDACFYKNIPAVSYLSYTSRDNEPMPSLREKNMSEAINDYRALRLLETLIGREKTLALCRETLGEEIGIHTIPKSGEDMLALRERINFEIEKSLK